VPVTQVGGDGTALYAGERQLLMSHHLDEESRLRQTRIGSVYAADEVELFVQAVEDALRASSSRLDASDVADFLSEDEHLLSERAQG